MSILKPYRVGPNPSRYDGFRATYPDGARVEEGDIVYIHPDHWPDEDGEVWFRRDSNEETLSSWIMASDLTPVEEVITIKRSDLPEMEWADESKRFVTTGSAIYSNASLYNTPEANRRQALAHLAAADFLEANPPTDPRVEAMVAALPADLDDLLGHGERERIARHLIDSGVEVTP